MRGLAILVTLVVLLIGAPMVFAKSLVLCSEFLGTLVNGAGDAVPGATVTRTWNWAWGDESGSDETVTGPDGSFRFPEVTARSFTARFVPHTPSIRQEISARTPNGDVLLFSVNKKTYDADGELEGSGLTGPGIRLRCRIDKEPSGDGPFWGTCEPDG